MAIKTATKYDLTAYMVLHCGSSKGVSANKIAADLNISDRHVRQLVTECREDGVAVCGHPSTGYFIAKNAEEMQETLDFLKQRALHSLKLASTLSKIPMADLIGQLHLRT
jgi:biotin operon repressor